MTTEWKTRGFKTGKLVYVTEDQITGNIISAHYAGGSNLSGDEIEEELF